MHGFAIAHLDFFHANIYKSEHLLDCCIYFLSRCAGHRSFENAIWIRLPQVLILGMASSNAQKYNLDLTMASINREDDPKIYE